MYIISREWVEHGIVKICYNNSLVSLGAGGYPDYTKV